MNKDVIERALKALEYENFDVKELWRELSRRLADKSNPTEDDLAYQLPDSPLAVLQDHFPEGRLPEPLSCGTLREGFSYTLTPGQRGWLRANYGLTPTETVTAVRVSNWEDTRHPKAILLTSDIHVDPRLRKSMLISANITSPGKFFRESAVEDQAIAERQPREGRVTAIIDDALCMVEVSGTIEFEARYKGLRLAMGDLVTVRYNEATYEPMRVKDGVTIPGYWPRATWQVTKRLTARQAETATTSRRTKKTFEEMFAELEAAGLT